MNGNGTQPPQQHARGDIDYDRLLHDAAAQIGRLTLEVMAGQQVVERLRAELAERDVLILQLTQKEVSDARP